MALYDNSFSSSRQIASKKLSSSMGIGQPTVIVAGFAPDVVTLKGKKGITPVGEKFWIKNYDI
jgi:hypothetical protein